MKLLVTVDTFYPCHDGVQNITQTHLESLEKKGFEVVVVTSNMNNLKEFEEYNNIKIHRVQLYTKLGIHLGNKETYINLVKKIASQSDLMINVCLQSATTDLLLKILKDIPVPKILYLHGMFEFNYQLFNTNKSIKNLLLNIYYNFRWKIFYKRNIKYLHDYNRIINIFEKDYATYYFQKRGFQLDFIHNYVEDLKVDPNLIEKENYIICVSNFSDLKNQKQVVDTFFKIDNYDNYKLILIGSRQNDYSKQLEAYISEKIGFNQEKIIFKYNLPRVEIYQWLAKSKLFLFASKVEKFPVVLLESLSMNTPFVSNDVGSIRYLPGGYTVGNANEMVDYANRILENDNLRNKLSNEGINSVIEDFNFKKENDKFEQIIREVISNGK